MRETLTQAFPAQNGDLKGVLSQLEAAMKLSQQLKDSSHDADIWGEMADTYADLGDFEKAAQVVNFHKEHADQCCVPLWFAPTDALLRSMKHAKVSLFINLLVKCNLYESMCLVLLYRCTWRLHMIHLRFLSNL